MNPIEELAPSKTGVFDDNIAFGLKFAGRRPRKYIWWGEETTVPWVLRTPESILGLIGVSV